ncbi:MAG: hypothetical protein RI947_922 [Candidatus Parcubacteria bacterium]|jgi:Zn-dependent protease
MMAQYLFTDPLYFVFSAAAILIAITVHEYSHARMADHLGDPTPRLLGRVSLNPLVHLDPLGTIFMLLVGFGWGKPVTFDPFNLEKPRRDAALISVAGPLSNFILAIICSLLIRVVLQMDGLYVGFFLYSFLKILIYMNILLGIFNLLPIHPLDGFKIVGGLLSEKHAREWYSLERYGFIFLLLLILPIAGSPLLNMIIATPIDFLSNILIPVPAAAGAM